MMSAVKVATLILLMGLWLAFAWTAIIATATGQWWALGAVAVALGGLSVAIIALVESDSDDR